MKTRSPLSPCETRLYSPLKIRVRSKSSKQNKYQKIESITVYYAGGYPPKHPSPDSYTPLFSSPQAHKAIIPTIAATRSATTLPFKLLAPLDWRYVGAAVSEVAVVVLAPAPAPLPGELETGLTAGLEAGLTGLTGTTVTTAIAGPVLVAVTEERGLVNHGGGGIGLTVTAL